LLWGGTLDSFSVLILISEFPVAVPSSEHIQNIMSCFDKFVHLQTLTHESHGRPQLDLGRETAQCFILFRNVVTHQKT